jgi:aspartate racemase
MPASQSAVASLELETPVRRFQKYQAAVQAMVGYEAVLCESASRRRSNGLAITDQDQPDEVFCLFPERPLQPPLAIIGGMGPLAGAIAFRRACAGFRNSRAIVLYQACSLPDRSTVILGQGGAATPLCREVAVRLAGAVRQAVNLAGAAGQPTRCLIACNSAHYFWRLLEDDLRQCEVQMISLVESSIEALKLQSCRKALVLATEGARVGQVFSAPFRDAGIAFEEPSPTLSRVLMRAIFEGVKALDDRRAVELGNQFFETMLRSGQDYDCVLAGCTELPLMIDLLRLRGSPAVVSFLSRVRIVDPLEEALCRA